MDVNVRFRFNKVTGQVEVFDIEDRGTQRLPEAEHNRTHDRIAATIGGVIERNPRVVEISPGMPEPSKGSETAAQPEGLSEEQDKKIRVAGKRI
jgi:hypothetical protein